MKSFSITIVLVFIICQYGIGQNPSRNLTSTIKTPDTVLPTGIYYITDSITAYKRGLDSTHCFYIKPTPIVSVKQFKKIGVYTKESKYMMQAGIKLTFDEAGTKAFDEATKKSTGKMLAIIIDNKLVSSPVIMSEIKQGKCIIVFSNFMKTQELENIKKHLESEK